MFAWCNPVVAALVLLLFGAIAPLSGQSLSGEDVPEEEAVWAALKDSKPEAAAVILLEWADGLAAEDRGNSRQSSSVAYYSGDDDNPYAQYNKRGPMLHQFCRGRKGVSPEDVLKMVTHLITPEDGSQGFAIDTETFEELSSLFLKNWCDIYILSSDLRTQVRKLDHIIKRWKILEDPEVRQLAAYCVIPYIRGMKNGLSHVELTNGFYWAVSEDEETSTIRRCLAAAYYSEAAYRYRHFGIHPEELVPDSEMAEQLVLDTISDVEVPLALRSVAAYSLLDDSSHLLAAPAIVMAALDTIDENELRFDRPILLNDRLELLDHARWWCNDTESVDHIISSVTGWEARLSAAKELGYQTRLEAQDIAGVLRLFTRAGELALARQIAARHLDEQHGESLDITHALIGIGDYQRAKETVPPAGEHYQVSRMNFSLLPDGEEHLDTFYNEQGSDLLKLRLEGQVLGSMRKGLGDFETSEDIILERATALMPLLGMIDQLPPVEGMRLVYKMSALPELCPKLGEAADAVGGGLTIEECFKEDGVGRNRVAPAFVAAKIAIAFTSHDWRSAFNLVDELVEFGKSPENHSDFELVLARIPTYLAHPTAEAITGDDDLHMTVVAQFWKLTAEALLDVEPSDNLFFACFPASMAMLTGDVVGEPLNQQVWASSIGGDRRAALEKLPLRNWGPNSSLMHQCLWIIGEDWNDKPRGEKKRAFIANYLGVPGVAGVDLMTTSFKRAWREFLTQEDAIAIVEDPETPWAAAAYLGQVRAREERASIDGPAWLRRVYTLLEVKPDLPEERGERLLWKSLWLGAALIEAERGDATKALEILKLRDWSEHSRLNRLAENARKKASSRN